MEECKMSCSQGQGRETPLDGGNFRADISFGAWSDMPYTRLAKGGSWYMRISANIQDVTGNGGIPWELPRIHRYGNQM
jgi:hypothetical protein